MRADRLAAGFHGLGAAEVVDLLGSDAGHGLSGSEAATRLAATGRNTIEDEDRAGPQLVRARAPHGWPGGRRLWVVATDFETGERVVFGRPGSPASELATAVAASCAIPGFYRPVRIADRRYVDGGVQTGANLDLAAGARLDLVICLNPLSSRPGAGSAVFWPVRALLHQQLQAQVRAISRAGARLIVLEPEGRSIELIGLNPMGRRGVEEVGVAAAIEVQAHLRRPSIREKLAALGAPERP